MPITITTTVTEHHPGAVRFDLEINSIGTGLEVEFAKAITEATKCAIKFIIEQRGGTLESKLNQEFKVTPVQKPHNN